MAEEHRNYRTWFAKKSWQPSCVSVVNVCLMGFTAAVSVKENENTFLNLDAYCLKNLNCTHFGHLLKACVCD